MPDNRLTVKNAETEFYHSRGGIAFTRVELDGEITLDGILKSFTRTDIKKEFCNDKYLISIPDTVQSGFVLSVYAPEAVCKIIGDIVCDGTEYYLPKPLDDPLGGNTLVRARVTLKKLYTRHYP